MPPTADSIAPLESVLRELLIEYRALIGHLDEQHAGLRVLNAAAIEATTARQESSRRRIATLDARRRQLVRELTRSSAEVPLSQLLATLGGGRPELVALASDLKEIVRQASARAKIVGRLTSSLLGHLNTAARLLNGDGRYGKSGTPMQLDLPSRLRAVA